MRYIESFREGMHVSDVYLCKNKQIQLTKNGKEYGNVVLQDKTGTIDAKIWDLNSPGVGDFDTMDYVCIEADVTLFQNSNQLNVRRIRKAGEGEYIESDYLPVSKKDIGKMYEELLAVEGKKAEREELYRKVTELFLADKKNDDAMRRIREGVTEYPDSVELQVLKLRVTCKEKEKIRRACRKALERAVKNRTDIQKNEDFRKLLQEQRFQMKGEKVCEKE